MEYKLSIFENINRASKAIKEAIDMKIEANKLTKNENLSYMIHLCVTNSKWYNIISKC